MPETITTDGGALRGSYDRHGKPATDDGFEDGDRVTLRYESPYSDTAVDVRGTARDVHIASFMLVLDDGRVWGVFGSTIRTTVDNRRQSGTTKAKSGRKVGTVEALFVSEPRERDA